MTPIHPISGIGAGGSFFPVSNTIVSQNQAKDNSTQAATVDTTTKTSLTLRIPLITSNDSVSQNNASDSSRYINATLNTLKISTQLHNQQNSRVSSLLDGLGGIQMPSPYEPGSSKGGIHTKAWFDMQLRRIQNIESQEASEHNLKEIRDNIESNVAEAQHVDSNGMPVSDNTTGAEGTSPQSDSVTNTEVNASSVTNEQTSSDEAVPTTSSNTGVSLQTASVQVNTSSIDSSQLNTSQSSSPKIDIVV